MSLYSLLSVSLYRLKGRLSVYTPTRTHVTPLREFTENDGEWHVRESALNIAQTDVAPPGIGPRGTTVRYRSPSAHYALTSLRSTLRKEPT